MRKKGGLGLLGMAGAWAGGQVAACVHPPCLLPPRPTTPNPTQPCCCMCRAAQLGARYVQLKPGARAMATMQQQAAGEGGQACTGTRMAWQQQCHFQ